MYDSLYDKGRSWICIIAFASALELSKDTQLDWKTFGPGMLRIEGCNRSYGAKEVLLNVRRRFDNSDDFHLLEGPVRRTMASLPLTYRAHNGTRLFLRNKDPEHL